MKMKKTLKKNKGRDIVVVVMENKKKKIMFDIQNIALNLIKISLLSSKKEKEIAIKEEKIKKGGIIVKSKSQKR